MREVVFGLKFVLIYCVPVLSIYFNAVYPFGSKDYGLNFI